jgi:hypothetical protein
MHNTNSRFNNIRDNNMFVAEIQIKMKGEVIFYMSRC